MLLTVLVGAAATNTGNNALYLVLAAMLALLVVSGVSSRQNLRSLDVRCDPPGEIFANRPFELEFALRNRSRWLPRWLLVLAVGKAGAPRLVPYLPRQGSSRGRVEMLLPRRGRQRIDYVHVSTIFPLGLFQKGLRYRIDLDLLVFPEIFSAASLLDGRSGRTGDESSRFAGWGHDLHALRAFRAGDDPRSIHWKQTARMGDLIFREREREENRRLAVLLDNATGPLAEPATAARFESLVSEAATAALDYLARGFDVALVTRDAMLPFATGARQRWSILEALALLEARPRNRDPLIAPGGDATVLRLSFSTEDQAA